MKVYEEIFFLLLFTTCVFATPSPGNPDGSLKNNLVFNKPKQLSNNNVESNRTRTDKKITNQNANNEILKENDLQGSAAEYGVPNFVPPSDFYGAPVSKDCHPCNEQPWIPVYSRSLAIPHQNKEYHSEALNSDIHDKTSHFHPFYPSLDEYSAPQSGYEYPRAGEVVEFMLPPPLTLRKPFTLIGGYSAPSSSGFGGSFYSTNFKAYRKPQNYFRYSSLSQEMVPPPYTPNFNSFPTNFGATFKFSSNEGRLKPGFHQHQSYSQTSLGVEGHPGVANLPLSQSNFNLKTPLASDSYGESIISSPGEPSYHDTLSPQLPTLSDTLQLPSVEPSDSYGSPLPHFDSVTSAQQKFPFAKPSGPFGQQPTRGELRPPHIESLQATLFKSSGATDVQVVPSLKIADYTASIEHPINLIQSPILDLYTKNQDFGFIHNSIQSTQSKNNAMDLDAATNNDNFKLSEKPIVVGHDDSLSSASFVVNTTVPSSSTTSKRHNDKYLSTEHNGVNLNHYNQNVNWFKNMILETNKDTTDKKSIVAIKKMILDPNVVKAKLKIAQPHVDMSTWRSLNSESKISDQMLPPKPQNAAWSNVSAEKSKFKPIQIIVPYTRNNSPVEHKTNAFTALSSIVTAPSTNAEPSLWSKYMTTDQNTSPAEKTTSVYNIKDFISENAHKSADVDLPYDVITLQKNIDEWTHQSYSNVKSYQSVKGIDKDEKTRPDIYLKDENNNQTESTTQKSEVETDPIVASSSDHIEHSVTSNNEISNEDFYDLSNDIDDDDDNNDIDNSHTERTTENKVQTSIPSIRFGVKQERQLWNFVKETKRNATHEKVYVVTPQSYAFVTSTPATAFSMGPKIQNGQVNKHPVMTKIFVRVEQQNVTRLGENNIGHPVKVVYSEWPHLINNLETTTASIKSTSRHPLFGIIDMSAHTTPANSTVETLGGHSKVTLAVTTPTKAAPLSGTKR